MFYNSPGGTVTESRRPSGGSEDREVDYLICKQCSTPCYIFEMDGVRIAEAQCLVCGIDEPTMFAIGEEAGSEEHD
jgi:hypothetical protein